jgi:hypothetical protein
VTFGFDGRLQEGRFALDDLAGLGAGVRSSRLAIFLASLDFFAAPGFRVLD